MSIQWYCEGLDLGIKSWLYYEYNTLHLKPIAFGQCSREVTTGQVVEL